MTPEELADKFPEQFRSFEYYLEVRDPDRLIEAHAEYNRDLAKWVEANFGSVPEEVVMQARTIKGCSPADFYRRTLGSSGSR